MGRQMTRMGAAGTALVSAAGLMMSTVALVTWSGLQAEPAEPHRRLEQGAVALDCQRTPEGPAGAEGPHHLRLTRPLEGGSGHASRSGHDPVGGVGGHMVRPVGVSDDGQMQLPTGSEVMGWYRFGPAPGSPTGGSVVLAGHLDSRRVRPRAVGRDSATSRSGRGSSCSTDEGHRLDYPCAASSGSTGRGCRRRSSDGPGRSCCGSSRAVATTLQRRATSRTSWSPLPPSGDRWPGLVSGGSVG